MENQKVSARAAGEGVPERITAGPCVKCGAMVVGLNNCPLCGTGWVGTRVEYARVSPVTVDSEDKKSDVENIIAWLERRCDYGPPCGKCTYCIIAKTIPWFDSGRKSESVVTVDEAAVRRVAEKIVEKWIIVLKREGENHHDAYSRTLGEVVEIISNELSVHQPVQETQRCNKCGKPFRYPPTDNKPDATTCAWCSPPPGPRQPVTENADQGEHPLAIFDAGFSGEMRKTAPCFSAVDVPKDNVESADPRIDFSCRVCYVQCSIAPDPPARAVCPEHCDDHNYVHDPSRAGKFCQHCDQEEPIDWKG